MNESHVGLGDGFEVSDRELDAIVASAIIESVCHRVRMTGAGFGDRAVALVQAATDEASSAGVTGRWREDTEMVPEAYISKASHRA
jgi:galactokinase